MRYITLLLIITISLFTISLAQDNKHSNHSSEHSTEHSPEEHSEEHSSDTNHEQMDHEQMGHEHGSESKEHADHSNNTDQSDHSNHSNQLLMPETSTTSHETEAHSEHFPMTEASDMNHGHHEHTEASEVSIESANVVMLGEKKLTLYPLLNPQGNFQLVVQSDASDYVTSYVTSASFEGESFLITVDKKGLTTVDLGRAKHGNYSFTFRDDNNAITVPISIYKAFTPSGTVFTTIFAPSPSLSSKGRSEVFIYSIADGENKHDPISVNYSMAGMQHSLDNTVTLLDHEHFDNLKSSTDDLSTASNDLSTASTANPVLESAMSNRSTLSFAMAGTWKFSLIVAGEMLTFDIAMLEN